MYLELSQDNLQEILSQNQKVIVQFGASWCGNCRLMKPKLKRFTTENENLVGVYVDAEMYVHSRRFADIQNLPTFAIYVNGEMKNCLFTSKEEVLKSLIDEITNL